VSGKLTVVSCWGKVRKESLDELKTMKSDNDSYLYEYLKNMEQTKKVIKETWYLADLALEEKNYVLRRKCLNDIANYAVSLNRFHDFLPAICSMKLFDNERVPSVHYDNNKELNIQ
jgi:hypothetical protein